ncbi:flavodoxin domain-containing protein [Clostridium gasigenes]|uniref:flavodoxin domain-containing protein n=1 Tax=Clostridium gasigenes TaxID=94869 RepID=UPI00209B7FAB|nr:flavodoxin domain-containing protein [Clostridium gasigenes]
MSKSVIVYKSKYGSTKVYAQWIAKKLEADIYEVNEVKVDKLLDYNNIIFGGGLYAGA